MRGVSSEEAKLYTGSARNELDVVFHFEHVDIGNGRFGKTEQEAGETPRFLFLLAQTMCSMT